jgi:hypothetical protein
MSRLKSDSSFGLYVSLISLDRVKIFVSNSYDDESDFSRRIFPWQFLTGNSSIPQTCSKYIMLCMVQWFCIRFEVVNLTSSIL